MRSLPASLGYLLLASALIVAPLTGGVPLTQTAPATETCCGCCPVADTARETVTETGCCSSGPHRTLVKQDADEPASSEPCGSDCGRCPCCAAVVPALLAILTPAGQTLQPAPVAEVLTDSDLLSTRSDKPLLPPPRG